MQAIQAMPARTGARCGIRSVLAFKRSKDTIPSYVSGHCCYSSLPSASTSASSTPASTPTSSSTSFPSSSRGFASTTLEPTTSPSDTTDGTITTDLNLLVADLPARWKDMNAESKNRLTQGLFKLQQRDWNELSFEEKRALYWIAFGPHGYREPFHPPGFGLKVFLWTTVITAGASALYWAFDRAYISPNEPETLSKEWQAKSNEWAKEHNINPIHGVSSGVKGSGFVDKVLPGPKPSDEDDE